MTELTVPCFGHEYAHLWQHDPERYLCPDLRHSLAQLVNFSWEVFLCSRAKCAIDCQVWSWCRQPLDWMEAWGNVSAGRAGLPCRALLLTLSTPLAVSSLPIHCVFSPTLHCLFLWVCRRSKPLFHLLLEVHWFLQKRVQSGNCDAYSWHFHHLWIWNVVLGAHSAIRVMFFSACDLHCCLAVSDQINAQSVAG